MSTNHGILTNSFAIMASHVLRIKTRGVRLREVSVLWDVRLKSFHCIYRKQDYSNVERGLYVKIIHTNSDIFANRL